MTILSAPRLPLSGGAVQVPGDERRPAQLDVAVRAAAHGRRRHQGLRGQDRQEGHGAPAHGADAQGDRGSMAFVVVMSKI